MRTRLRSEGGFTLVELLVASAMSIVLVGAVGSMMISAVRSQPQLTKRAQNITTARWVLERMTREIRNGIAVDKATSSSVSFRTYVRRTTCGGSGVPAAGTSAIPCEVTYTCTTTSCTRLEAAPGVYTGTPTTIFSGLGNSNVFCYVPSTSADSLSCGTAKTPLGGTTYIGLNLYIPNPSGGSGLTVSDGASLRNATLSN